LLPDAKSSILSRFLQLIDAAPSAGGNFGEVIKGEKVKGLNFVIFSSGNNTIITKKNSDMIALAFIKAGEDAE
jgi:hypothetical protein